MVCLRDWGAVIVMNWSDKDPYECPHDDESPPVHAVQGPAALPPLCRVFERLDGTLAIHHPDLLGRMDGESEVDWLTHVFARAVEAQPELDGLPFVDVDPATLPDRATRDRWRVRGGVVVVIEGTAT